MIRRLRELIADNPIIDCMAPWRRTGRNHLSALPFVFGYGCIALIGDESPIFALVAGFLLIPLLFALLKPPFNATFAQDLYLSGMNPRAIQLGMVFWAIIMCLVSILLYLLGFAFFHLALLWPWRGPRGLELALFFLMVLTVLAPLFFSLIRFFFRYTNPSLLRYFAFVMLILGANSLMMGMVGFIVDRIYYWYADAYWGGIDERVFVYTMGGLWLASSSLVSLLAIFATPSWAVFSGTRNEDAADHDPDAARLLWRQLPALERFAHLGRYTRKIARLRPGLFVAATLGFLLMLILVSFFHHDEEYGYLLVLSAQATVLIPCSLGALLASHTWVLIVSRWRGNLPLFAENVRLGAALLRGPVVIVCLFWFAILFAIETVIDLYVWNIDATLLDPYYSTVLLADGAIGLLAMRTLHLWGMATRYPRTWICVMWVVLLATTGFSTRMDMTGFISGSLLILVPLSFITLRPFGIEVLFVTRLHRLARQQSLDSNRPHATPEVGV